MDVALILNLKVEEYGREMYKIAKVFQGMKKEADKDKKGHSRLKDSKAKEVPEAEMAAVVVAKTVQDQIRDFKVCCGNYYLSAVHSLLIGCYVGA